MAVPIQFTNRNGASSETLQDLTTEKFQRLYKFASNITKIHVIFSTDNLVQMAEAEVHIPKVKKPVYAKAKSEDMYKSVDSLVDKLTRQLSRHKEKTSDH